MYNQIKFFQVLFYQNNGQVSEKLITVFDILAGNMKENFGLYLRNVHEAINGLS